MVFLKVGYYSHHTPLLDSEAITASALLHVPRIASQVRSSTFPSFLPFERDLSQDSKRDEIEAYPGLVPMGVCTGIKYTVVHRLPLAYRQNIVLL